MKNDTVSIEKRIKNMKNFYLKINEMIDNLPDSIPKTVRDRIKDEMLGDKELKELMDGIDAHRPPRLFLIGRTGVGKSSLINALCGSYLATVSDTKSCTKGTNTYECKDKDRVLMEILDTRGIAESESIDSEVSAEQKLIKEINEFSPDVAIFMLNCTHRDDVNKDTEFLKKVSEEYSKVNKLKLPIIAVVNKCDEMAPARYKKPSEYPETKISKINEMVQYYKEIINKNGLKIENIVPVSSLIDWKTPDGKEVGVDQIDKLPQSDIDNLQIAFDGRYKIEELFDILSEAILDSEAQAGLRMAFRLEDLITRIAKKLIKIFSSISAVVAATPIPTSDIYILLIIQSVLVALIASLSGRDISIDTAKEFILSLGGITGAGYIFKLIAQQGTKFINMVFPGAGSAISSVIAFAGTSSIGNTAILYYIKDNTLEEVKKQFEASKKQN